MQFSFPLLNLLINAEQKNFTGRALVQSPKNIQWKFYFFLGQLIWVNGGMHPNRSWLRQLVKFASEVNCEELFSDSRYYYECSQYQTLYLLSKKQLISKDCLKSILETRIKEHFLDILQEAHRYDIQYIMSPDSPRNLLNSGFKPDLAFIESQKLFVTSYKYNSLFEQSPFKNLSLNLAPKVVDSKKVEVQVDFNASKDLIHLLKGQLTLKDLSLKLNKDVLQVTHALSTYYDQGILELIDVSDLASNFTIQQYTSEFLQLATPQPQFTVTCIDDHNKVHQMMNQIVTDYGGRFVGIQDEFQVLPRLIEDTPDMIFIKMTMPVVNGYELCAQIKRIPQFNQIPIIMLSKSNSLTERMRAKLVGISDFMKPFDKKQITKIINKFTPDSVNLPYPSCPIRALS